MKRPVPKSHVISPGCRLDTGQTWDTVPGVIHDRGGTGDSRSPNATSTTVSCSERLGGHRTQRGVLWGVLVVVVVERVKTRGEGLSVRNVRVVVRRSERWWVLNVEVKSVEVKLR